MTTDSTVLTPAKFPVGHTWPGRRRSDLAPLEHRWVRTVNGPRLHVGRAVVRRWRQVLRKDLEAYQATYRRVVDLADAQRANRRSRKRYAKGELDRDFAAGLDAVMALIEAYTQLTVSIDVHNVLTEALVKPPRNEPTIIYALPSLDDIGLALVVNVGDENRALIGRWYPMAATR